MLRIIAATLLVASTTFAQTPLETALAALAEAKARVDTLSALDRVQSGLEAIGEAAPQALETGFALQPNYRDPLYVDVVIPYYAASEDDKLKWRELRVAAMEGDIHNGIIEGSDWRWSVHQNSVLPLAQLVKNTFYSQPEVNQ